MMILTLTLAISLGQVEPVRCPPVRIDLRLSQSGRAEAVSIDAELLVTSELTACQATVKAQRVELESSRFSALVWVVPSAAVFMICLLVLLGNLQSIAAAVRRSELPWKTWWNIAAPFLMMFGTPFVFLLVVEGLVHLLSWLSGEAFSTTTYAVWGSLALLGGLICGGAGIAEWAGRK